jgi:plasmid stability protein
MSKMIQLRNVPDALYRTLKARAAMAGKSLSDYLLAEIRGIAQRADFERIARACTSAQAGCHPARFRPLGAGRTRFAVTA